MRLDAKTAAGLTLPDGKKDVIVFDDALNGFGYRLRAGAGGKVLRSWIAQYRVAGRSRRVLVGQAGVVGAEQARARAKTLLAQAALGQDPQGERSDRRGRDALTFARVAAEYLAGKRAAVRPRTFRELERYLGGDYFKAFHGAPIDRIGRRELAARLVEIARESGAAAAAKARSAVSDMLTWALRSGLIEANPAADLPAPATGRGRERVLSDAELARAWLACGDDDHGKIVRLLVLTGARRQEIGGMRWSELDFDRGTWTLPAARSKSGRPHVLPLMPAMVEVVGQVARRLTRDHLFGERADTGFNGWCRGKAGLDERAGVVNWVLHDLRRTCATRMADLGVQPHIVEAVLNHQSGHRRGVAGVYNKSPYAGEVKAALALWHDHVRSIVAGGDRKVVLFPAS